MKLKTINVVEDESVAFITDAFKDIGFWNEYTYLTMLYLSFITKKSTFVSPEQRKATVEHF